MTPNALDRPLRTLEEVADELWERLADNTLAWKCTGGHDFCPTMLPSRDCPYCENDTLIRLQTIEAEIALRNQRKERAP